MLNITFGAIGAGVASRSGSGYTKMMRLRLHNTEYPIPARESVPLVKAVDPFVENPFGAHCYWATPMCHS
jgi:hypothetical protein